MCVCEVQGGTACFRYYFTNLTTCPTLVPSFALSIPSPPLSAFHCATPPSVGSEAVLSVGDPLTLTCTGGDCVGTTTFNFSWLLDGSPVDTSLVTAINNTTSQLSVTSVTSADFGTYTCQVMSVHGAGTAVAYVRERREFPQQLSHCRWITPLVMSHLCHWVRWSMQ